MILVPLEYRQTSWFCMIGSAINLQQGVSVINIVFFEWVGDDVCYAQKSGQGLEDCIMIEPDMGVGEVGRGKKVQVVGRMNSNLAEQNHFPCFVSFAKVQRIRHSS